jgi:hypothetical protein
VGYFQGSPHNYKFYECKVGSFMTFKSGLMCWKDFRGIFSEFSVKIKVGLSNLGGGGRVGCQQILPCLQVVSKKFLGTRFEARNCISEPCPQEPYRDIF